MASYTAEPVNWNLAQKMTFRFFMIFFILYIFFEPNGVLPFSDTLAAIYLKPFFKLIPWLGAHVLHLAKPITIFTNGSGDTTYDYLIILFITVIALTGMAIWSVTGRNTKNYNKLFYWLCVIVRFYVAITMVVYGSVKIVKLQFPSPSPGRLLEPVGNMSPMGLAWTYMGYSTAFNYFTGLAEFSCGLLLFFRRTTTLGAIMGLVVAGNIMAINYCFDVPVKLLSTMLVLMSLFLLFRDYHRLLNFFFKNREAAPSNLTPHRFKTKWKNIVLVTIKYLLVAYVVIGDLISAVQGGAQYGDKAKKPLFYGIYNVVSFVRNKDTLPPLITDTTRWNKLLISYKDGAQIKFMNDSLKYYSFKPDTTNHAFVVNSYTDTLHKYVLYYSFKKDTMLLNGAWKSDTLHIRLAKYDFKNFRLLNRGFHMINETPYNK